MYNTYMYINVLVQALLYKIHSYMVNYINIYILISPPTQSLSTKFNPANGGEKTVLSKLPSIIR